MEYISINGTVNANSLTLYVQHVDSSATGEGSTLMTGGYLALLAECKYTFIDVLLSAMHAKTSAAQTCTFTLKTQPEPQWGSFVGD